VIGGGDGGGLVWLVGGELQFYCGFWGFGWIVGLGGGMGRERKLGGIYITELVFCV